MQRLHLSSFTRLTLLVLFATLAGLGYTRLVQVEQGGTGAATAAGARTNLQTARVPVAANANPTVNDDAADGYEVGQTWVNTSTDVPYVLVDATTGSAVWRSLLTANAALVEVSGGQILATGGALKPNGSFQAMSSAVALTAEDDTYGEVISGDTITVATAGLVTGDTGAIQSNSRRYKVTLSALGISLSDSSPRPVSLSLFCDDAADIDVRAGTLALLTWLGVGSTTALDGVGLQRPSTGSDTWTPVTFRGSTSTFTTSTASALNFGAFAHHQVPSDDGAVLWGGLSSTGAFRGTGSLSGGAISASLPDTIVWALRATAGASGATYTDCRALYVFGATLEDL